MNLKKFSDSVPKDKETGLVFNLLSGVPKKDGDKIDTSELKRRGTFVSKPEGLKIPREVENRAKMYDTPIKIVRTNGLTVDEIFKKGQAADGLETWISDPFKFKGVEYVAFTEAL